MKVKLRRLLAPFMAALTLASLAEAQDITTIVIQGDYISGVGNVISVGGLAVDDAGQVVVHVLTDNPVLTLNAALIDAAQAPLMVEGLSLNSPPGALISSFQGGAFSMASNGGVAMLLYISGATSGSDDAIYTGWTPNLLAANMQFTMATAPELAPGFTFGGFLSPRINASGKIMFHTILDDPSIPGSYNTSAVYVIDTVTGLHSAPFKEGDILPGLSYPLDGFSWGVRATAFNDAGQILFAADTSGPTANDSLLLLDGVVIAREGDTSPFGTTYTHFQSGGVARDLNNHGDFVFTCGLNALDADRGVVLGTGGIVVKGETMPFFSGGRVTGLASAIFIGDDGAVLWGATWETSNPNQGRGLLIDYTLLVHQGVTEINGLVVLDIPLADRSFTQSPSGQYALFEARLQGGLEGAFLIDLWQ